MDLIGAYLQGRLKGDALTQFLSEVESNPTLKKELELQQAIQDGIEFHHNQQLRKRFEKIKQEAGAPQQPKIRYLRFVRIAASTAAVIILCFAAYTFFFPSENHMSIYANYFEPAQLSITRSTDIDAQLAELKELYNTKQYEKALPLFESVLDKEPTSNLRLAYGSALLNSKNITEAKSQFESILKANDPLYSDTSRWYLALLELRQGNIDAAKSHLQDLVSDESSDYHEEAKQLIEDLDKL